MKWSLFHSVWIAVMLAGVVNGTCQPSPPAPPGFEVPLPKAEFGKGPIFIIHERYVFQHIQDFRLPDNYFVMTPIRNIPAAEWNQTSGTKLRSILVEVETNVAVRLDSDQIPSLVRTNCIAIMGELGPVEQFEFSATGELEMAWVPEATFKHYLELAKLRGRGPDADSWHIKYVSNRGWYAMEAEKVYSLRRWIAP